MSVSIRKLSDDVFEVTVAKTSTTTHTVTVTDQSLMTFPTVMTKTQLLEFSFRFLLEREPNTSILSSFDINVISRYCWTTKMKSDDGAMRVELKTVMSVMTQSRCYTGGYDDLKDWVFLCGKCLTDVKSRFEETYQYGGTWKSKKK